ncbi:uncharacterized protein BYT42DRAFT_497166 [Radiomyces spectabilis]|uniref:uncharacterized protein n=1 Tax=Radiomyces spectabilis TaxID=64574 RepID=UPI002220FFBA|nr:uncharacterized protein BYT42DRAFT_497166 [Radiomyces spectabilis]KAI8377661.1 hypothetical protein BYT42DRAFT_497166 [Radiomyces spectabilis]
MIPTIERPATCELCGQWMPRHNPNCPRNGVHPSQWFIPQSQQNSIKETAEC